MLTIVRAGDAIGEILLQACFKLDLVFEPEESRITFNLMFDPQGLFKLKRANSLSVAVL